MRIISGKFKGRVLHPPGNLPVRPTTDFAKTGLFNILESRLDFTTLNCLDLYSGTGSISLELISRGAKSVISVDRDYGCIHFLKDMCKKLGITNLDTVRADALKYIEKTANVYDLIFADPPFDLDVRTRLHEIIFTNNLISENGFLIVEHGAREDLSQLGGFSFSRNYGNVTFSFFSNLDASKK